MSHDSSEIEYSRDLRLQVHLCTHSKGGRQIPNRLHIVENEGEPSLARKG
jgi:hypothetical protein